MKEYDTDHIDNPVVNEPAAAYTASTSAHLDNTRSATDVWNLFCSLGVEQRRCFATQVVGTMSDEELLRCRVESCYQQLWEETRFYSGIGPWLTESDYFRKLQSFGKEVTTVLKEYSKECPDYMRRHIGWVCKLLP